MTYVEPSAGGVKPQRARERERWEEGVFLCCFVVFVCFFEQGKKATEEAWKMENEAVV